MLRWVLDSKDHLQPAGWLWGSQGRNSWVCRVWLSCRILWDRRRVQIPGPSLGFSDALCLEWVLGICIFLGFSGENEGAIWKAGSPICALCTPGLYSQSSYHQNECHNPKGEAQLTHLLPIAQSAQLAQAWLLGSGFLESPSDRAISPLGLWSQRPEVGSRTRSPFSHAPCSIAYKSHNMGTT